MQYRVNNQEKELFKKIDISLYKVSQFMTSLCDNNLSRVLTHWGCHVVFLRFMNTVHGFRVFKKDD